MTMMIMINLTIRIIHYPGKHHPGKPCIETNIQAVQLNLCLLAGDVDELMPNLRPNFQQRWQHFQDPQRGVRKSGCWDNESNVKLKHKDLLKPCEYSILIHMKQIIQYWYVLICIYWICSYLLMSNKMSLTIMMIFNVVEIPFYLPIFDPERWDEKNLNAFDESAGASPWQDGYGSVTSTPAVCAIRTVARRAGIFWIQRFNGKNGKK